MENALNGIEREAANHHPYIQRADTYLDWTTKSPCNVTERVAMVVPPEIDNRERKFIETLHQVLDRIQCWYDEDKIDDQLRTVSMRLHFEGKRKGYSY